MGYYQCQYVFLPSFIGDDELTHFMETVLNQLAQWDGIGPMDLL